MALLPYGGSPKTPPEYDEAGATACLWKKWPAIFDNAGIAIWNYGTFHTKKPFDKSHNAWNAYTTIDVPNGAAGGRLSWWGGIPHWDGLAVASLHMHNKEAMDKVRSKPPGG